MEVEEVDVDVDVDIVNTELANDREQPSDSSIGFFIKESDFYKVQKINSQLRLLRELAARPQGECICITASALEETLCSIEQELAGVIDEADYLSK